MTIQSLVAEFAKIDQAAATHYVSHDGDDGEWPTVGFDEGDGRGHAVVSVHPEDIAKAVTAMSEDVGPDSNPVAAFDRAGIRCKWHI